MGRLKVLGEVGSGLAGFQSSGININSGCVCAEKSVKISVNFFHLLHLTALKQNLKVCQKKVF